MRHYATFIAKLSYSHFLQQETNIRAIKVYFYFSIDAIYFLVIRNTDNRELDITWKLKVTC